MGCQGDQLVEECSTEEHLGNEASRIQRGRFQLGEKQQRELVAGACTRGPLVHEGHPVLSGAKHDSAEDAFANTHRFVQSLFPTQKQYSQAREMALSGYGSSSQINPPHSTLQSRPIPQPSSTRLHTYHPAQNTPRD